MGYPLEVYEADTNFVNCKSERMPFDDDFFDVIISRNALDHVDNFEETGAEIKRVLRSEGALYLLINYHKPTRTEPQSLSDAEVIQVFGDLGIKKVYETEGLWGFSEGKTVLWSNMGPPIDSSN